MAKFSAAVGGLNDKDKGEGRGVWNAPNVRSPSASRALPAGSSGSEIRIARGPEHVSARAMPSSACEFTIKNDARKGRGGRRSLHAEGRGEEGRRGDWQRAEGGDEKGKEVETKEGRRGGKGE